MLIRKENKVVSVKRSKLLTESVQPFKFNDIIVSDTLYDNVDSAQQAKRRGWNVPEAANTAIQLLSEFNNLCDLEKKGTSKQRLLKLASHVQELVQQSNRDMDGGDLMLSWQRWLGSDFNYVKGQMRMFASDIADAIYDLKNSK